MSLRLFSPARTTTRGLASLLFALLLGPLAVATAQADPLFEALKIQILGRNLGWLPQDSTLKAPPKRVPRIKKETLLQFLAEDFDVHIADGDAFFDRSFLTYLFAYFSYMQIEGPIDLHVSKEKGHRLVWAKDRGKNRGRDLYFARNAADKIANRQIEQFIDSLTVLPVGEVNLTIEYNNELFEQLTLALTDTEHLTRHFKVQYGLELTPHPKDPEAQYTDSFLHSDMVLLLKNLHDLPQHLFHRKLPRLQRIVRMCRGYTIFDPEVPGYVKASYNPRTQTIQITDLTFTHDDMGPEGIFLHEFGHAIWKEVLWQTKDRWENVSWEPDPETGEHRRKVDGQFATEYSLKNPEEDFSEHFSLYINNREQLVNQAPLKFSWLKKHIFLDTEYFVDAAENLKIFVPSEREDLTPPFLRLLPEEAVTASSRVINAEEVEITVDIRGLFDDMSGVDAVDMGFDGPLWDFTWGSFGISRGALHKNLIDAKTGHYRITQKRPRRGFFPHRIHKFDSFNVKDRHGNRTYFDASRIPGVLIDGTFVEGRVSREKTFPLNEQSIAGFRQISLEPYHLADGRTAVHVTLPVPDSPDLGRIKVYFDYTDDSVRDRYETPYYFVTQRQRASKPGDKQVRFDLLLPSHFTSEKEIRLSTLALAYQVSAQSPQEELSFHPPDTLKNLRLTIPTNKIHMDTTDPAINPNDIQLELADADRDGMLQGHSKRILVKIPMTGIDKGMGDIRLGIRTPRGETLYGREIFWRQPGDGVYVVSVELPSFHEAGEYVLSFYEAWENHDADPNLNPDSLATPFDNGGSRYIRESTLQRGIRKTIKLDIPSPIKDVSDSRIQLEN